MAENYLGIFNKSRGQTLYGYEQGDMYSLRELYNETAFIDYIAFFQ